MNIKIHTGWLMLICAMCFYSCFRKSQEKGNLSKVSFTNPILPVDYSDPDVIEHNGKYYLTASSFNNIPGLPLLESTDLVHWKLKAYAIQKLEPDSVYNKPKHGNGVWAPAIRFHNNQFYIYYSDPDYGLFMVTAPEISGPWSQPYLVQAGKGWIDPCPFWDNDGKAWLVHAWAGSRAGIKSTLVLHQMSSNGKQLLDNGVLIFDGHDGNRTVEGPKMYKRNGYYYVFAPAGGVTKGWQLVLRSKNIYGPYECRKVLHQGQTSVNGPHQGAWITDSNGNDWFYHFQDKNAFGRVVHLQPLKWMNDWPLIGTQTDSLGLGEPVIQYNLPTDTNTLESYLSTCSDEFNTHQLNLNWQWQANSNPQWGSPSANLGFLRLNACVTKKAANLWESPNILLQKFPAIGFIAETKLDLFLHESGDKTGLIIMGTDYAYIGIERKDSSNILVYRTCPKANEGNQEQTWYEIPWNKTFVYLRVKVNPDGKCSFAYSGSPGNFTIVSLEFTAQPGRWTGAKCGLFCNGNLKTNDAGYINADWFRFTKFN